LLHFVFIFTFLKQFSNFPVIFFLWTIGYIRLCLISMHLWIFQIVFSDSFLILVYCDWKDCITSVFFKLLRLFYGLTNYLSWRIFYVHLRVMCSLLLVGDMFYRDFSDLVGLWCVESSFLTGLLVVLSITAYWHL
jgi:hypothetical protein